MSMGRTERLVNGSWLTIDSSIPHSAQAPYLTGQRTRDETHPGPPYKTGGPFESLTFDLSPFRPDGFGVYDTIDPVFISGLGNFRWRYIGGFCNPNFDVHDFTDSQYANFDFVASQAGMIPSLDSFYSMVGGKLRPQLSQAGVAQAIGESGGIPSMLRSTARTFRNSWRDFGGNTTSHILAPKDRAGDWLNFNFGWVPFVRDLGDVLHTTKFLGDYIADLTARNNTWQKVNRVLSSSESNLELGKGGGIRCNPTFVNSSSFCRFEPGIGFTGWSIRSRVTTKVWASGEYKFYMPEFDPSHLSYDDKLSAVSRALTLYGAQINPVNLWKITPWSWLIDWFANVGDVIQNVQDAATDGVVSRNLYLMHRKITEIVLKQDIYCKTGTRSFEFRRRRTSKQRDHASTPFGFGLTPTTLSGRQWSILGALGISKFT
jgi:hypothetical protein